MNTEKGTKEVEQDAWTREFTGAEQMAYPSEYAIRIFKGRYPRLSLKDEGFQGKRILDAGCGDGRNVAMLSGCGFKVFGAEITEAIAEQARANLANVGVDAGIKVGFNHSLPFEDSFFDYLMSWNACYYLGDQESFDPVVDEFARLLKPGGTLVLSIPKSSCFIYQGSDEDKPGYRIIRNDPFKVRDGAILRMFSGEEDIQQTFSSAFENFNFGSTEGDCFGLAYDWHLVVCQRKAN